jgi:hypothetical protein
MNPSDEQKQILDEIRNNNSVIGDCVAGSGKTTTVLFLAKTFPDKKILQITYNSQLKIEVREKVEQSNLTNLEIHTYHSLAVRYYDERAHDDNIINYIIKNDVKPKSYIPKFDIIVIDETQDMTLLFYKLIHKFLDDHNSVIQMLVLGDKYQSIYQFKGADVRYLTLSSKLWNKSVNFVNKTLNTSYRLTNQMSSFINNVMLGEERIRSFKNGPPVTYLYGNSFHLAKDAVFKYIYNSIKNNSLKPDDIFILAPSIKKKFSQSDNGKSSPLKILEHLLVSKDIPIYYPTSDDASLDENIIKGKVVFSTFHQSKGRERKVVVIFNFDSSYFKYYDRTSNPNICPPTLYVAATRAKSQLILLHGENNEALPFFKKTAHELKHLDYVHFIDNSSVNKKEEDKLVEMLHNTTPTELVSFISEKVMNEISVLTDNIFILKEEASYYAKIPNKLQFDTLFEDVSDINGLVIPAIYEEKHTGSCTIRRVTENLYNKIKDTNHNNYLKNAFDKLKTIENVIENYTYLGIMYISLKDDIHNKINQITRYNWLSEELINMCLQPLNKHLTKKETLYEESINFECDLYKNIEPILINGRVDAIDNETIWELKCVDNLSLEHFLQVVIYAWIWKHAYFNSYGKRMFKLLNMKTGELYELVESSTDIEKIMKILMEHKYGDKKELNDEEFIETCLSTRNDIDFIYNGKSSCMMVDE